MARLNRQIRDIERSIRAARAAGNQQSVDFWERALWDAWAEMSGLTGELADAQGRNNRRNILPKILLLILLITFTYYLNNVSPDLDIVNVIKCFIFDSNISIWIKYIYIDILNWIRVLPLNNIFIIY